MFKAIGKLFTRIKQGLAKTRSVVGGALRIPQRTVGGMHAGIGRSAPDIAPNLCVDRASVPRSAVGHLRDTPAAREEERGEQRHDSARFGETPLWCQHLDLPNGSLLVCVRTFYHRGPPVSRRVEPESLGAHTTSSHGVLYRTKLAG